MAASRLRATDYGPLIEKISDLIKAWTSLTISYAGRLELLRSVIQGICCYWLAVFPIPAIIIDRIEGMCRQFLWGSKMSHVAWRQVCLPKDEGGLGLRDIRSWNKALLAKTLWNIHLKKDMLWVKWVNEFFLRGCSIWEWVPKSDSPPIFKNLIRIRDEMVLKEGTVHATILQLEKWNQPRGLHVSSVYEWLRPRAPSRPCFRTIWHSLCEPKHSFMVWLVALERLQTKDRLKIGDGELACVLCHGENESHSHLFFQCTVVREIWGCIRRWLRINRHITTIRSGLKWTKKDVQGTSWLSRARRIAFHCLVYTTWTLRNKVLKENIFITIQAMVTQIQVHVYQSLYAKFPEFERTMSNGAC